MRFDPMVEGVEDLATAAREELVTRFGRWCRTQLAYESADPQDVDLVLQWKASYADGDYGFWTRLHVDDVLLDHLPRKLSASPQEAATLPGSLGAFVRFLDAEGLLDPESEPSELVEARALAQRRAFLDAMADPSNFGMAKRLFGSFGFDEGDVPDPGDLEAAIEGFNALPFAERGQILGFDDAGDDDADLEGSLPPLPVREMPTTDEIEALAAEVPLLRQVDAFHRALGPAGVKFTKAGNLTLADARQLVAATGVEDRVEGVRSSADLPRLFAVGSIAIEAGATQVVGNRLVPVDTWGEQTSAERWQRMVTAVYDLGATTLAFGAATPSPLALADLADLMAGHVVAMLWVAIDPLPVGAIEEALEAGAHADGTAQRVISAVGADHFTSLCADRADDMLRTLTAAGVVSVSDGGEVVLTDAGAYLSAGTLSEYGFGVVKPEEVAALDAASLIDLLEMRGTEELEVLHALWIAGRDPSEAAHELVAALLARPDPVRSLITFSVLEPIGTDAVDAVRGALDTAVAGHAWLFLATVGAVGHEDVPRDLITQMGVEMFLATSDGGTPADVVELVLGSIPAEDHRDFIDELSTAGHERTGELLDLLGRHHPDETVGRHARKAAHRWRSGQGRAAGFVGSRSDLGAEPVVEPRERRPRGSKRRSGRHRK